jgi:uncharacterized membrane protein
MPVITPALMGTPEFDKDVCMRTRRAARIWAVSFIVMTRFAMLLRTSLTARTGPLGAYPAQASHMGAANSSPGRDRRGKA